MTAEYQRKRERLDRDATENVSDSSPTRRTESHDNLPGATRGGGKGKTESELQRSR